MGLYTVAVLAQLERQLGKPVGRCFDLVAGTSVGGLVALSVAAEIPMREIQEAFEKYGPAIFSGRPAPKTNIGALLDIARFAFRPKYSGKGLRRALNEMLQPPGQKLRDLRHPLLIPLVNHTKGGPEMIKTPHHVDFCSDAALSLVDVCMAACAAPTYFPLAEIGDALFVDGALYANSPDALALYETEYVFKHDIAQISMLSVGTTTSRFSLSHDHGRNLGLFGWAKGQRLMNAVVASQQQSVSYMMRHKLKDRYLRLDSHQSKEQERHLALDVATEAARKTLRALASATTQAAADDPILTDILGHTAAATRFFDS